MGSAHKISTARVHHSRHRSHGNYRSVRDHACLQVSPRPTPWYPVGEGFANAGELDEEEPGPGGPGSRTAGGESGEGSTRNTSIVVEHLRSRSSGAKLLSRNGTAE